MTTDQQNITPKILYIMGAGRSGSTILNIILGAHPEIEAIGEAKHWAIYNGLPRDHDANKENVMFWENVLKEYTKREGCFPDFDNIEHIRYSIESHNKLIDNLFRKTNADILDEYYNHISNLLSSIYKVSGKKIVLDASKNVCRAYKLLKYSNFNVKVIHLVRDPRGIVWSFMKRDVEHKPKKPLKAIFDYIMLNIVSVLIRYSFRNKVIKVKYEDLIRQPGKVLKQIFDFMDLDYGRVIEMIDNGVEFDVKHILDGNRIRKNKTIKLNPDEEWKKELPYSYKVLCTILAWPIYLL